MEEVLRTTGAATAQLIFSDRPENDFGTLAQNMTNWHDDASTKVPSNGVFLSMAPRSFYKKVVPSGTIDVGFSLACLHHLEHLPAGFSEVSEEERKPLMQAQSRADLLRFLRLRGEELQKGGMLALSFVSQASSGRDNYAGLVDACRSAMIEMVQTGVLPLDVAKAFVIPTYDRTLADVEGVVKELTDLWKAHELFEDGVFHPALEALQSDASDEASEEYASKVVDWLMAVCSGYFLKAVSKGIPDVSAADADVLFAKWADRTKRLFLRDHKDEEVFCSFTYVLLERL